MGIHLLSVSPSACTLMTVVMGSAEISAQKKKHRGRDSQKE